METPKTKVNDTIKHASWDFIYKIYYLIEKNLSKETIIKKIDLTNMPLQLFSFQFRFKLSILSEDRTDIS